MELRHLRYFVTVAEELHFSRAAARLNIGQPPLSLQIRALEHELDTPLFERTQRRVYLTDAGRAFLVWARRILADADEACREVRRITDCDSGELRIGFTTSTPFTTLMQHVLHDYRTRYPNVALSLYEMVSDAQVEAIERRRIDIGFVRRSVPTGNAPSVRFSILSDEALVVVVPRAHPLAQRRQVAMRDLAGEPFIMHPPDSGTAIHQKVRQLCEHAGFQPRVVQEARESATIVALAATGLGVSILPAAVRCIHIDGVRYLGLSDKGATSPLLLAHRHDDISAIARAFVSVSLEVAGRDLPA